ncbi:MAG: peptide ABC transporter substrate-binding protein, partial [Pseudomonadota bacterium]
GENFTDPGNYVSNGAYRLEGREASSVITLRRNEQFWNADNVAIDQVRWHIVVDEMSEINRYRAGELDMTSTVPSPFFEEARVEFPDELKVAPTLSVYYYGFNVTKPPFKDNLALRQALSMAVDREKLVETITARGELPAYSWVPPGIENYESPVFSYAKLTQEERNKIAKQLYRQAGYSEENPAEIELRYNTSDVHRRIAVSVSSMWSDVLGVETNLINEEFRVLVQNMREREVTQAFRSNWSGDYTDAVTFLGIMAPGATWNLPGYDSAEFGELMESAARQVDLDARRLYLEEAERILLRDHPVLPLYFYVSKQLVKPRVLGRQDNLLNYHYSQYLSLADTEE